MPLLAETKSTRTFELPKPGTVHAVLAEIRDLGLIDQVYNGKAKKVHKVLFRWQLAELDEEKQPKRQYERFTLSLHEKAGLRKRIKEMFGKEPPASLDLEKLTGYNGDLVITHNEKDGKKYANIAAVIPRLKDAPKLAIVAIPQKEEKVPAGAGGDSRSSGPADQISDDDIPF